MEVKELIRMSIERPIPFKKGIDQKNTLYVPSTYFQKWVKKGEFPNQISFGSKTVLCQVVPHPDNKIEWQLSEDLWQVLSIPFETAIHVFEKDKALYLGPLVGIFSAGFTDNLHRPIGNRSIMFSQYLSAAKKLGGYFCIFGAHHIDWKQGVTKGFFYTEKGWKKCTIPLPNVIYDRLPNRKSEKADQIIESKEKLSKEYLIPWFNPNFFDKWNIHTHLEQDQTVKHYLPQTRLAPTLDEIKTMLTEYQQVYVKPANGSLGIGVQQIIKLKTDEYYYCRFRQGNQNKLRRFKTLKQLIQQQFPNGSLDHILVQQGIQLIQLNNRPVDFRVHTNKNGKGEWSVSAIGAKIAGPGSVTTHINNGGVIKSMPEILQEMKESKDYFQHLNAAALALSHSIDNRVDGLIGEIGFDLGIDKKGQVWLFEANSKPGRSIFAHPDLKSEEIRSRTLPFEYALYLSQLSLLKPGIVLA
ncbi:YheC/YheD family protein [Bacillus taeanensis]|uniref:YheC/YheD family protein n=2 Tax=Bacillus taeanensis TaxID=273032 RepID=A0A366XZK1_9BACI|nr:YheC/YheD family protein [Bacillus taeanensis]